MQEDNSLITRRDFIRGAGCAAIGLAVGLPLLADENKEAPLNIKSRVVLVRHAEAVDEKGQINGDIIQQMLDDAMVALYKKEDPVTCWKQIITHDDIVGIKTNVWRMLPTTTEVEQAIKKRILDVGVPEKNIGIDDRGVLDNPVFQKATALINARPMRTHSWSGVGSLIKNYIMFVRRPPDYHENSCANLGAIWQLPHVKDKTRLNILVLLTPLFYGVGPHHFDTTYVWKYRGLLVGTDPVAVDTVGLQILQAKRRIYFGEDRPIKPAAHHVAIAGRKFNLGTSDPEMIDLIKVGWMDEVLI